MKNVLRIISALLCASFLICAAGCSGADESTTGASSQTETGKGTEADGTTVPDETTAVPDTGADTVTEEETTVTEQITTDPPKPETVAGMMVYYEDFSSYGDVDGTDAVMKALGWKIQTSAEDHAPSDWTARAGIKDGRLYIENNPEDKSFSGKDGYALMLDENYMKGVEEFGTYTLQYDVTYGAAANSKRYLNIVTEYDGEYYNSYHFRVGGYGNNQVYYAGKWYTYDAKNEDDLFAAQKTTGDGMSTIAYKLLGRTESMDEGISDVFRDVTVTVRVIRGSERVDVLMKTADMPDFVRVSRMSEAGDAYGLDSDMKSGAVCFKTGGAINGFVDNIAIWTGDGDMPADTSVNYAP